MVEFKFYFRLQPRVGLANFFCKKLDSKYRLCRSLSQVLNSAAVAQNLAIENLKTNGHGFIPIKLWFTEQVGEKICQPLARRIKFLSKPSMGLIWKWEWSYSNLNCHTKKHLWGSMAFDDSFDCDSATYQFMTVYKSFNFNKVQFFHLWSGILLPYKSKRRQHI